ncbi:hypothetical protein COOONC_06200, partial [Cooperia oncophora]
LNDLPQDPRPSQESKSVKEKQTSDNSEKSLVAHTNEQSSKSRKDPILSLDHSLEKILADLEKEEWYHGYLPFEDIVGLMKDDGDFLLRGLEPEGDHHAMVNCIRITKLCAKYFGSSSLSDIFDARN